MIMPAPSQQDMSLSSNDLVVALVDHVAAQARPVLAGDYACLLGLLVQDVSANIAPNGSTVVALTLHAAAQRRLADCHQWVDLFVLGANARLGEHYHRHASASIIIVNGSGTALIDGTAVPVQAGEQCRFPAGCRHDVHADSQPMLFLSFQDHPILAADGTLDYHVAGAA
jgi:mannose-6-phosphate isomerase-like protein (cupin superfamily)